MSVILPPISRLSSRVVRLLGCNPSPYTFQGTNTYLVGTGPRRILVDCGSKGVDEYLTNLKDFIDREKVSVSRIIITHWHPDHVGGLAGVLDKLSLNPKSCPIHKIIDTTHDYELSDWDYVSDGALIKEEGATLRVVHTPGHTADHISLILEEENVLFSGDCVLGQGRGVVFEDLSLYLNSLRQLASLKPRIIYPGHGPVVEDPLERIEEYITRQLEREARIVAAMSSTDLGPEALAHGADQHGFTLREIFQRVWEDAPPAKVEGIMYNLKKHINKLLDEKRVTKVEEPQDQSPDLNSPPAEPRFKLTSPLSHY